MTTTTTNGHLSDDHQREVAEARESLRPHGAVILVTGASKGIGAAIARELAADGWAVAAGYRSDAGGAADTVSAIEEAGGSAIAIGGDVCDPDSMQDVLREAGELGPVLGLVNNAGVRADGLAVQIDDDQWDLVLETNLTAAFRLTRAVLRPMMKARYGRIVNVASVVGPRANAGQANYAAAKAGLIGMTKTIGVEIARRGVTVNAVAPGFIETEMTADLPRELLDAVPARRPGRPDEVADAVRFLASDAASYVTATTLFVDGGMSA
ncbi:MAG: 3-oxoacyl-[acyl-carrier protein] reductase [Solirubrobacteraceae bacterium]|jgi:3-oxoacyl-[acyl-carrier protein] reductase|nr:3-oxoacyl-[acyl-carrier protein] reductase [Solirubrobacteraceae bacterium]